MGISLFFKRNTSDFFLYFIFILFSLPQSRKAFSPSFTRSFSLSLLFFVCSFPPYKSLFPLNVLWEIFICVPCHATGFLCLEPAFICFLIRIMRSNLHQWFAFRISGNVEVPIAMPIFFSLSYFSHWKFSCVCMFVFTNTQFNSIQLCGSMFVMRMASTKLYQIQRIIEWRSLNCFLLLHTFCHTHTFNLDKKTREIFFTSFIHLFIYDDECQPFNHFCEYFYLIPNKIWFTKFRATDLSYTSSTVFLWQFSLLSCK